MARKPVNIAAEKAAGKPYGRQAIWLAFREESAKGPVGLSVLAACSGVTRATVRTYMESLVLGGYASKGRQGDLVTYSLIRDIGVQHPRVNKKGEEVETGRDAMWRSMKMLSVFTATDLALTASTSRCAVSPVDAADFCKHLHHAGYLGLVEPSAERTYRLFPAMRTGPLAPMVQRTKVVFDQNLNKIMWHEEMEP